MAVSTSESPRTGASVIVKKDDKILLIKRGNEPYLGKWSLPGGAQELGETLIQTANRELEEETCIVAKKLEFLRVVDRITQNDANEITHHYVLAMYLATEFSGSAVACDDAKDIGWYTLEDLKILDTTPEIPEILSEFLD